MSPDRARLLFVCTANRARSPLAEVIAREVLDAAALLWDVSSAGFLESGWRAEPEAIRVAKRRGLDLTEHVSAQLDDELIERSDLILTMTSDHALEVASQWPSAVGRTFVLGEVESLAAEASSGRSPAAIRSWAAAAASGQRPHLLGATADVADPVGRGTRAFRRAADQITAGIEALVERFQ